MTGNGVLTQVYVDSKEKEVTVSVIDSYVAEVYKVDEKDGTITLSDLVDGPADASDDEFATTLLRRTTWSSTPTLTTRSSLLSRLSPWKALSLR